MDNIEKAIRNHGSASTFIGITTITKPKMRKTIIEEIKKDDNIFKIKVENPFWGKDISKISSYNAIINGDYEKKVNRNLVANGLNPDFTVRESHYRHLTNCILTDKKTESKKYLQLWINSKPKNSFRVFENGIDREIPTNEIKKFLYSQSSDEFKPKIINPNFESIHTIKLNGKIYTKNSVRYEGTKKELRESKKVFSSEK